MYNPEHGAVPTEMYLTPESLAVRALVDEMYDRLEPWIFEKVNEEV